MIRNWSLDRACGNGLLLCNFKRAEAKLRKYYRKQNYTHATLQELIDHVPISTKLRDSLGMVIYPGATGATVTSSCAPYNWVGGQEAGPGRFVTSVEIAGFMGIDSASGPCEVARRYYRERALCGLLAEAVHSRVADLAADVGVKLTTGALQSVGSLYSGAFDVLGSACLRVCPQAHRSFVAEIDPGKLTVLWESFGPHRCYRDVASVDGCYPADFLVASPPCLLFSRANRSSTDSDKLREATNQTQSIRRVIVATSPRVVVVEQTDGLRTHCRDAFSLYERMWDGLPYRVYLSALDAHTDCSGSHHRRRLIWVAILESHHA
jgi:hypothetical protein